MLGQKDVSGIAAIQHSLRDVDSRTSYVRFVVYIGNSIDRAAVNSHPQLNVRVILQGSADLERTANRFLGAVRKKERHPVTGRHPSEFARAFRRPETLGAPHDLVQFLQ